ncbi:hypothetical protein TNCV_3149911 [Trichonephila clavipes]|nr:hypothetical protein TNCV_3149911 [Trichonephila clavipes]
MLGTHRSEVAVALCQNRSSGAFGIPCQIRACNSFVMFVVLVDRRKLFRYTEFFGASYRILSHLPVLNKRIVISESFVLGLLPVFRLNRKRVHITIIKLITSFASKAIFPSRFSRLDLDISRAILFSIHIR